MNGERPSRGGPPGRRTGGRAVGKELVDEVEDDEEGDGVPIRVTGDRLCPECGVKLSQYNPGPNCWSHTIGWPWRGPSAKPRF
jgi:hypothetical protein